MKKISFLSKLKKEGKLEIINSSEEIKKSYFEKSESNLISSKLLFENNRLEESVALAYYSMYHILTALLFKVGIKCENHTGSIILLKELFLIDNSDILIAKKERLDKQYYTDFNITKEEVKDSIKSAEIFNDTLRDFISKLTSKQLQDYRVKLKEFG